MAFIERTDSRPVIDLAGMDGNAFALLGLASEWGRQLGWSKEKIQSVLDEMKSSDYRNLVNVLERELGEYADFILPENW